VGNDAAVAGNAGVLRELRRGFWHPALPGGHARAAAAISAAGQAGGGARQVLRELRGRLEHSTLPARDISHPVGAAEAATARTPAPVSRLPPLLRGVGTGGELSPWRPAAPRRPPVS